MLQATKTVLAVRKYLLIWLVFSLFFLGVYIILPINLTPGNTLDFFLKTTPSWQLGALSILAMLMGLMVSMQFYIRNELKSKTETAKTVAVGIFTSVSSVFSGLFSSVTCANCIAGLLAVLGFGSSFTFLLLQHQLEIISLGFVLAITSIYYSAKRIAGKKCEFC